MKKEKKQENLSPESQEKHIEKNLDAKKEGPKKSKKVKIVYAVIRILVVAVLIYEIISQDWNNVSICVLALILFFIPSMLEKRLEIVLPSALEIIIIFFIFAAQILGEVAEYYLIYDRWDDILHTINGFLAAAIGFAMIDMLNQNSKIKFTMTPFFTAAFALCFSMTVAVFWEFFEYAMDRWFGNDMQKDTWLTSITSVELNETGSNVPVVLDISSVTLNDELGFNKYLDIGLHDTMHDMWVNFLGAIGFSVLGYTYIKNRGKGFASKFIPQLAKMKGSSKNNSSKGEKKTKKVK